MPKQMCLTPHRCDTCNSYFKRKGDLTRHVKLHKGIRYICEICEKPFSQQSGLKTHLNVHSGDKPYACNFDDCTAVFGDPSSAARHRKETHRRLGAYRCPIPGCGSSIKRRSAFAHHLRKHSIDPDDYDIDSLAPPLLPVVPMPSRDGGKVIFVPGTNSHQKPRRRRSLLKGSLQLPPSTHPYAKLPAPPNSANTPPTSASDIDWTVDTQSPYHQNVDDSRLHYHDMKPGFEFLDWREPNDAQHSFAPSVLFSPPSSLFFTDVVHTDSTTVHPPEIYDMHLARTSGHFPMDPSSKQQVPFYESSSSKDLYHHSKELAHSFYFPLNYEASPVSESKGQLHQHLHHHSETLWTPVPSSTPGYA